MLINTILDLTKATAHQARALPKKASNEAAIRRALREEEQAWAEFEDAQDAMDLAV